MNFLENYYANYDEEGRLASKHGQVEFLTTMKYIHEIIGSTEKKKILEVGAGTGRYSIALAKEGHEVDAMDDATFDVWLKYHFSTCERMDLIGATNHSLDILEKIS